MKDLLTLILTNITTHPDKAQVDQTQEDGVDVYTITVEPDDMGRVIGKSGKVIRAIRTLVYVAGIRSGTRARVKLNAGEEVAGQEPSALGASGQTLEDEIDLSEELPQEKQEETTAETTPQETDDTKE